MSGETIPKRSGLPRTPEKVGKNSPVKPVPFDEWLKRLIDMAIEETEA